MLPLVPCVNFAVSSLYSTIPSSYSSGTGKDIAVPVESCLYSNLSNSQTVLFRLGILNVFLILTVLSLISAISNSTIPS